MEQSIGHVKFGALKHVCSSHGRKRERERIGFLCLGQGPRPSWDHLPYVAISSLSTIGGVHGTCC